jgi:hypothetical protein
MILGGEKKKIASLIVSRMKPSAPASPVGPAAEDEGAGKDAGLLSAADEIMSAVHAKDAQGLVEALKSFLDMAEGADESEPESEE